MPFSICFIAKKSETYLPIHRFVIDIRALSSPEYPDFKIILPASMLDVISGLWPGEKIRKTDKYFVSMLQGVLRIEKGKK